MRLTSEAPRQLNISPSDVIEQLKKATLKYPSEPNEQANLKPVCHSPDYRSGGMGLSQAPVNHQKQCDEQVQTPLP